MKKAWEILVIILLNLMLLCAAGDERATKIFEVPQQTFSQPGDSSSEVERIQLRLKQLGYFYGEADGFFGLATRRALKDFQRDFSLETSGTADEKTLHALNIITENNSFFGDTDYELMCCFAAAQCKHGKKYAVMSELMQLYSLSKSGTAPESLAALLFQPGRFEFITTDGLSQQPDEHCRSAVGLLFGK